MQAVRKRQTSHEFTWTDSTGSKRTLPFLCYQPSNFQADATMPLLLFLHGAGERGTDLKLVTKHGPPKLIDQGEDFPMIVVSPQCPPEQWWADRENLEGLFQLVQHLQDDLPVDPRRTYLTGMSMGGYGTFALTAAHGELFAAVIPVCGGGDLLNLGQLPKVPLWAFHGRDDDIVPLVRSEEIVDAIQKNGGDARLTIYDNVEHDSWSATYSNPDVYDWLLSHELPKPR
ncbi:prolyl oligopeptidase family serine peptidase [Bremerella cremea]|uniref:carboxylesterase family protein n=1 Tax=Bremerella cremea TaxID=1031537 RepID=UPI0031EBB233